MKLGFIKNVFLLSNVFFPFIVKAIVMPPQDQTINSVQNFDRSNLPTTPIHLWQRQTSGYDTQNATRYGDNYWVCQSTTSYNSGACSTTIYRGRIEGHKPIQLNFFEKKSNRVVMLNVMAYRESKFIPATAKCGEYSAYGVGDIRQSTTRWCETAPRVYAPEVVMSAYISPSELAKIPTGGIWEGNLLLNSMQYNPNQKIATWRANIILKVSDINNITAYFPEFHSATPTVDLALQVKPTDRGQMLLGEANLDMCLYDGFNAQSRSYEITLTDEMRFSGRKNGHFSIVKSGVPTTSGNMRIDYRAQLTYNGNSITLNNNETVELHGIDGSNSREVFLPNIPQSVYCTPTPLKIITDQIFTIEKNPGLYRGNLKITFTPSI